MPSKPEKPYEGFPLFPHASGQWAKKIRGKTHYFGAWADWRGALDKYVTERDDLQAGRKPREQSDCDTRIHHIVNGFLNAKRSILATGELSHRSFEAYETTGNRLGQFFGRERLVSDLRVDDFNELRLHLSKKLGAVSLGNEIQRVRSMFKYAYESGLIPNPMNFGPLFKKPSAKTIRRIKNANGQKMFEADELATILNAAGQPVRTMILLGINCGFGPTDIAMLRFEHLDLERGWIDFPRPKTEVRRRCCLWPETIQGLREWLDKRPIPRTTQESPLVFITKYGLAWVRINSKGRPNDEVGKQFGNLVRSLKLKRKGIGFYALRHTFETIGGESLDQPAVDWVMGHADPSMAANYRHQVSDERLKRVSETVRSWLFQSVAVRHFCDTSKNSSPDVA